MVATRELTVVEALNEAIREEMRRDETVFIMGEDIRGGVYGASGGLFTEFGENRVLDTPLSEAAFIGAAVGAAAVGMRPSTTGSHHDFPSSPEKASASSSRCQLAARSEYGRAIL